MEGNVGGRRQGILPRDVDCHLLVRRDPKEGEREADLRTGFLYIFGCFTLGTGSEQDGIVKDFACMACLG